MEKIIFFKELIKFLKIINYTSYYYKNMFINDNRRYFTYWIYENNLIYNYYCVEIVCKISTIELVHSTNNISSNLVSKLLILFVWSMYAFCYNMKYFICSRIPYCVHGNRVHCNTHYPVNIFQFCFDTLN
jgi:hypothetical protein